MGLMGRYPDIAKMVSYATNGAGTTISEPPARLHHNSPVRTSYPRIARVALVINIGPAGVPIALSKLVESGRLESGDRVALMGIGSGINCSMSELVSDTQP